MIRRPPRSTRTDTLFPYTTLFRSVPQLVRCHEICGSIQESSGSVLRSFGRSARVPANLRGISMKILNKIAVAAICSAFAAKAPASAQEYYARHKLEEIGRASCRERVWRYV